MTSPAKKIPLGARILKVLTDLYRIKGTGVEQEAAFAEMQSRKGRYDPALLAVARECFEVTLPASLRASAVPLTLKDLRPGQLLISEIETDDGVLVIRNGQVISARLLHKLRNFAFTSGIKEPIYVVDLLENRKIPSAFEPISQSQMTFLAT